MSDNDDATEPECPVCGQPYQHSVSYGGVPDADCARRPTFRDDVAVCETGTGVLKTAFVHHERNAVVKSITRKNPTLSHKLGSWVVCLTEPDDGPYRVESYQFADRSKAETLLEAIAEDTGIRDTIFSIEEVDTEAE